MKTRKINKIGTALAIVLVISLFIPTMMFAKSAEAIDIGVRDALEIFKAQKGVPNLLNQAVGMLVFPEVYKVGVGLGGEYGEGALLKGKKTIEYYSTASASVGWQLGGQKKTVIYLFMTKDAYNKFVDSDGWKAGVDASVAVITFGVGATVDTNYTEEKPVLAFILDQKGLMYNLSLEGTKISRIKR
jgi:lipid-binding SYLF domain-containing protein